MFAVFSLLPILILYALIIYVFYKISRMFSKRSKRWNVKRIWTFLLIYIGIGFVTMLILSLATTESNRVMEQEKLRDIIEVEDEVWQLIDQNRLDEIDDQFVVEEWTYNLPSNEFAITRENADDWTVTVVVSKREDPQSTDVYGKVIRTPYTNSGIDITNKLPTRSLEIHGNELMIEEQEEIKLIYNLLDPTSYLVENFRGWKLTTDDIYNYITGMEILHLNVPEHINIIDKDEIILYSSITK